MSGQPVKGLGSKEKLGELIKACIIYGADQDGKITKTKLAKLVYLADFVYFYHNLKPISGVRYQKLDHGPVSLDYFDQLIELSATDKVQSEKKGKAILFSTTSEVKDVNLDTTELEIVKKICSKWKNKDTEEIVKFTHDQTPWKISFENDEIPYSLIVQQDEATLY